jgi:hypothetical protein
MSGLDASKKLTILRYTHVPHAAEAHQRDARCWRRASFADLVEQRAAIDKSCIAAERHETGGLRWSLGTFCVEGRVSAGSARAEVDTYQVQRSV